MGESSFDKIIKLQQKFDQSKTAMEALTRAEGKIQAIHRASNLFSDTAIEKLMRANPLVYPNKWYGYTPFAAPRNLASYGAIFNALKRFDVAKLAYLQFDYLDEAAEEQNIEEKVVIQEATRIKTLITDIYRDNERIYTVAAREFEELVAELLYARGFKVDLTQQTRDGGYDILAVQEIGGFPIKFLVECKRHSWRHPVGVGIIRSFMDVINTENANAGLIVTTSYFTKDATDRQQKAPNTLILNDKNALLDWVAQYYNSSFRH